MLTIQNNVTTDQSFSFQMSSTDTIYKQINFLNSEKNDTKLVANESALIITNI